MKIHLAIFVVTICTVVHLTSHTAYAQEKPITKENLIRSLNSRTSGKRLSADRAIELIDRLGVDFKMTVADEQEIRHAGEYLDAGKLNDLVTAVRRNYRPPKGTRAGPPGERLQLLLFDYVSCNEYREQFADLLRSQVFALSAKFNSDAYNYLSELKLVEEKQAFNMSLKEANEYWDTTGSLQIMNGICSKTDGGVSVISQVFLGNLHGTLDNPIRVSYKINADEYGLTKDIHSLLILYSLAKDAQNRRLGKDVIINYLQYAYGIATDCKVRNSDSIEIVKKAVIDMLRELGAIDPAIPTCPGAPARPAP